MKTLCFAGTGSNWKEHRSVSPTGRTLGRQKRIVEPCLTPATTPISQTAFTSPVEDRGARIYKPPTNKNSLKNAGTEKPIEFGSPDSPMTKMNIMSNPSQDIPDGLLSPKSISQLEFPTPERLLPIGQHGKDGICALVEKVREALALPDISHLKHDSTTKAKPLHISLNNYNYIGHFCVGQPR